MITRVKKLDSLPDNPVIPILQFSPGGPFSLKAGNFVEMEDSFGDRWIGNFQTKGGPDPVLLKSGAAIIFGGRNIYAFNSPEATKTFEGFQAGRPWNHAVLFELEGEDYLGTGSEDGGVMIFDEKGRSAHSISLGEGVSEARHRCDAKKKIWEARFKGKGGKEKTRTFSLPELEEV